MKSKIIIVSVLVIIIALFIFWPKRITPPQNTETKFNTSHDATYIIDGQKVTLQNGVSEINIPNSSAKITTKYFGNEVKLDLNNDGIDDSVFLITQETGGSGTFFYVVAMLNTPNGKIGSQALFLGDRIAPQSTNIDNTNGKVNVVVVNYADRNPGESFSVQPSLGKSIWIKLDTKTMQFGEVVQNFEGEADPNRMTLNMMKWSWINTIYNNDTKITPKKDVFSINFKNDGTFSATTDCNNVGGEYSVTGKKITLSKIISTLMYCDASQESEYVKMLSNIDSFNFTSKGELIFDFKLDSGTMTFK